MLLLARYKPVSTLFSTDAQALGVKVGQIRTLTCQTSLSTCKLCWVLAKGKSVKKLGYASAIRFAAPTLLSNWEVIRELE